MDVRLIREMTEPTGSGPGNGMYALQRALRAVQPDWLHIGGDLQPGELPWYWCWHDANDACMWAAQGRPFVMGPNIFFCSANHPGRELHEQVLLSAISCQLIFTESDWYADLINKHLKAPVPVELWPYPIDPMPPAQTDPAVCDIDLLVYAKSGVTLQTMAAIGRMWKNSRLVVYGMYEREEMLDLARRSRVCLYLSESDRGPLALAEILLCGCPAVGVPQGAPWIRSGHNGAIVPSFCGQALAEAYVQCLQLDRGLVAAEAASRFDPRRVAGMVMRYLEAVRG